MYLYTCVPMYQFNYITMLLCSIHLSKYLRTCVYMFLCTYVLIYLFTYVPMYVRNYVNKNIKNEDSLPRDV